MDKGWCTYCKYHDFPISGLYTMYCNIKRKSYFGDFLKGNSEKCRDYEKTPYPLKFVIRYGNAEFIRDHTKECYFNNCMKCKWLDEGYPRCLNRRVEQEFNDTILCKDELDELRDKKIFLKAEISKLKRSVIESREFSKKIDEFLNNIKSKFIDSLQTIWQNEKK